MKKLIITIALTLTVLVSDAQTANKLWYDQPAHVWTEALPVGNGRLGAMIFGGVQKELLQLNEATLWAGGPVRTNVNPSAYEHLLLVRKALFEKEDYAAAYELTKKIQGYYSSSYLPMGDLVIQQSLPDTNASRYYRDLDIDNAISTTRFTISGVEYTRQVIASAPDQVIVVRLTASKIGQLSFSASLQSQLKNRLVVNGSNSLLLKGKAPAHLDPNYVRSEQPLIQDDTAGCNGMRFETILRAVNEGGQLSADSNGLHIRGATTVTLFITAATSFNGFDKCPDSQGKDEHQLANGYMQKAQRQWSSLLARHKADFQRYYNRVSFQLNGATTAAANLPMNKRLEAYAEGNADAALETLYFQFGRYLLISCSRPGGPPANLQGIWNKEMRPPWSSNYTTNINVQMNYWPAEAVNLSEMHQPFIDFITHAAVTGKVTAREFYHAGGWAMHHNSDIWALSNPVGDLGKGDPMWANWTMGSPWLSQHLWTHYAYTNNKKYLRDTAYPIMKDAAAFCMDWLQRDKDGWLVTAPSVSPENTFFDDHGNKGSVSIATTMDMSIIWDLFTNLIDASAALNEDAAYRQLIMEKRKQLYPLHIGKKGNLQEWYKDWEDPDPHHRHVSHLFGLFPGRQISPLETPAFAAAAKKTLELRGDAGTGWSLAWKINFWARLRDGNHAYNMIRSLLHLTGQAGTNYASGGGSYANLFDAHPPFQIDGNFGGISGMTEMLLQSQNAELDLLPALPDPWKTGRIAGLKARGNFTVSMQWSNGSLQIATIRSNAGGECLVRTSVPVQLKGTTVKSVKDQHGWLTRFASTAGNTYELTAQ